MLAQRPSVEQLDVERLEIAGAHDAKLHLARLAAGPGVPEQGRRFAPVRLERVIVGGGHGPDVRQRADGGQGPLLRSCHPIGVARRPGGQRDGGDQHVLHCESRILPIHRRQRLPEQRAGNRQRDGHRHLGDHQRAIDEPARPGGDASRHPRRPDQPRDGPAGKHHHGDQREPDGKRRDAEIDRRRGEKWERRRQEPGQRGQRRACDQQAAARPCRHEHERFERQLAGEPAGARAERRSDRELAAARLERGRVQRRQVRARNQQHGQRGGGKHQQRRARVGHELLAQRHQVRAMRIGRGRIRREIQPVGRRTRADAGRQAPHHAEHVRAAALIELRR